MACILTVRCRPNRVPMPFSFSGLKAPGLCLELERRLSKERGDVARGSNSVQAVLGLL